MTDDLRDLTLAAAAARTRRQTRSALLVEQHDFVIERDVALRPAQHFDGGCQFAARLAWQGFDPPEDLDPFGGDPTFVLPPSGHPRTPCVKGSAPLGPSAMRGGSALSARLLARKCEGRPGTMA